MHSWEQEHTTVFPMQCYLVSLKNKELVLYYVIFSVLILSVVIVTVVCVFYLFICLMFRRPSLLYICIYNISVYFILSNEYVFMV